MGELVPTEADVARAEGRDYETAEQLLARVKAEREPHADPVLEGDRTTGNGERLLRRRGRRPRARRTADRM